MKNMGFEESSVFFIKDYKALSRIVRTFRNFLPEVNTN